MPGWWQWADLNSRSCPCVSVNSSANTVLGQSAGLRLQAVLPRLFSASVKGISAPSMAPVLHGHPKSPHPSGDPPGSPGRPCQPLLLDRCDGFLLPHIVPQSLTQPQPELCLRSRVRSRHSESHGPSRPRFSSELSFHQSLRLALRRQRLSSWTSCVFSCFLSPHLPAINPTVHGRGVTSVAFWIIRLHGAPGTSPVLQTHSGTCGWKTLSLGLPPCQE